MTKVKHRPAFELAKTAHSSPVRVSYGASIASILENVCLVVDVSLFSLQTCHEELQAARSGGEKLRIMKETTKLLQLAFDMLRGPECTHFTALMALNRLLDLCVIHRMYHPWEYEEELRRQSASDDTKPAHWGAAESSSVHAQLESLLRESPKVARGSPKSRPSWRTKGFGQQESLRSLKSLLNQDTAKETSFSEEAEVNSAGPGSGDAERTPMEILLNADPACLFTILQNAMAKHKTLMGTRHRCTPSLRWRHCQYHCLQILAARVLNIMCHGSAVQYKVITEGHIKVLVDALDPNHDPVSIWVLSLVLSPALPQPPDNVAIFSANGSAAFD